MQKRFGKRIRKPQDVDDAEPVNEGNCGDDDQSGVDMSQHAPPSAAPAADGGDGVSSPIPEVVTPAAAPASPVEVLELVRKTRGETLDATKRILRDLESAKAIEVEALETLHRDLDKFRRMEGNLEEIDGNMARAKMQITALGRRLVKDGCFKVMAVLLLCVIIVLVILIVSDNFGKIGGGGGGNGRDVVVINNGGGDSERKSLASV